MKNEMKRGLALLLCLAMVVGVFVGVPGMTTVADAAVSVTPLATVPGGDFESVTTNHYWTLSNKTQVKIVADAGRDGSSALYINDNTTGGFNAYSNRFDVQPGTSITYSVWSKGIEAQSYLFWFKADGTACSTANSGNSKLAAADDWTLTTVTKTVPADAAYAEIRLATGAAATGEAWFDDVSVRGTKINVRNTNLPGFLVAQNYNIAGTITTTYDATTDTASIETYGISGTFVAGGRENLMSSTVCPPTANTTYVVEFTVSNITPAADNTQTTVGWIHVYDNTSKATVGTMNYTTTSGNAGKHSFEFTTLATDTTDLQLQVRPRQSFKGTHDLSGLTVYAKCGELLNGSFDESVINVPGWTFTSNADTSWAVTTGNDSNTGITITDNNSAKNMVMTSEYIAIPENYWRQNAYITVDAKTDSTCSGFAINATYYDADYNAVAGTNEKWTGGIGENAGAWAATASGDKTPTTSWATYNTYTHGVRYIPYGAKYMKITVSMGVAATGTVTVDNVTLSLRCSHKNGTHEDPATTAESTLAHNEMVAPTYKVEGTKEYYECSICGVKYAEDTATTELTDLTLPVCKPLRNIDQGNSLDMIFALKGTDLTNMNIDPANVTADISFLEKSLTGLEVEEYTDATYGTLWRVEFPNISAKEMFDVMTVKFYNGEEEIYSGTQNIRSYANDCINDETISDQWKKACIDLLHYGAAAQTYFNHRTNQLANSGVAASETVFTQDKVRTVSVGEEEFIASAIRFQSNLKMTFAVAASTGATSGTITFTNHKGVTVERTVEAVAAGVNGQSALCFEFDGMVVADIDCDITFTAYNGETVVVQAVDSMDAYIGRVAETSAMYELAQAFGKYSTAAYTYLHS